MNSITDDPRYQDARTRHETAKADAAERDAARIAQQPTKPVVEQVKTFKRELALVLLAVLAVVGVGALFNEPAMLIFDKLRWPVFTFTAGAFGLDAVAKQWGNR